MMWFLSWFRIKESHIASFLRFICMYCAMWPMSSDHSICRKNVACFVLVFFLPHGGSSVILVRGWVLNGYEISDGTRRS